MTPSLPTFSIASASRSPIARSLLALIAPTWAISSLLETVLAIAFELARSPRRRPSRCRGGRPSDCCRRRCCAVPSLEDRPGQHGGGRRAVAGDVGGLVGHFVHELGAHVLEAVFELDFLADGDAVLGDGRAAERLVDDHIAAGRAHRDGDRVGQLLHAREHLGPGVIVEQQLLCHGSGSLCVESLCGLMKFRMVVQSIACRSSATH